MTNATEIQTPSVPQEIDTAALDQVVGAGVVVHDARKQEQSDKATAEKS